MTHATSELVTVDMVLYPILRVVSFWIHPVSLSIHLLVFLLNRSGNDVIQRGSFYAVFLDYGHVPHHCSILLPQALTLLRVDSVDQ